MAKVATNLSLSCCVSIAGLAIVGVLAPGWDLRLVDLRLPEANLRPRVLLQPGLLGH